MSTTGMNLEGMNFLDADSFKTNKKFCLRAAKELGYSAAIIERIHEATTPGELERAMVTGRHEKFGK